ncbi:MAG: YhbY family RNA-binding protein [Opitutae bacterium]
MVELSGRKKRELRSILKTRPVDLKIGKRGLTEEFMRECAKILSNDRMIKLSLPADKNLQNKWMSVFSDKTSTLCIAKVGKTAAFYQPDE